MGSDGESPMWGRDLKLRNEPNKSIVFSVADYKLNQGWDRTASTTACTMATQAKAPGDGSVCSDSDHINSVK